jgi:hypothetical protein
MRLPALLVVLLLLSACSTPVSRPPVWQGLVVAGEIADAALDESSGLAPSHRGPGLYWSHNDSGGEPVLFALGPDGQHRGHVRITGAVNYDWEDLASFELDGRAWLLVADTGDNAGRRTDCRLYIIAEPDPAELSPDRELAVPIAWTVPVRYADRPRDCESVSVDAREGFIYLLAKREHPAGLYRLPLRPDASGNTPAAELVGEVAHIPQPGGPRALLNLPTGRWSGQSVAMDFAPDGSTAVVLTYISALIFPRTAGESWAHALARPPAQVLHFLLPQAEAACFSPDSRTLLVSTEGKNTPLLRWSLRSAP